MTVTEPTDTCHRVDVTELTFHRYGLSPIWLAPFQSTWLKIVSSWPTSVADHCDRLMSWRVQQKEYERVSETRVFPSLDRVSGTLCLSHYVTETSHLHSLRDFWRHFDLCRAAAHSDCCFFCAVYKYSYLLTYCGPTKYKTVVRMLSAISAGLVVNTSSRCRQWGRPRLSPSFCRYSTYT